jgi:uncharacterized SAM-binding protein YcdF (DUF218 family)
MRLRRLIILGIIAALLIPNGLALWIFAYGTRDAAQPADVIVILGSGARRDGTPSFAYLRRIRHAVALYERGYAPYLLCTGGATQWMPISEGESCANYLRGIGIPPEDVLVDNLSMSTEENAIEAAHIMRERGFDTAVLVSDNFHLFRAELLFRAEGITVYPSPAQSTSGALSAFTAVRLTYREVLALGWYAAKTVVGLRCTDIPCDPNRPVRSS